MPDISAIFQLAVLALAGGAFLFADTARAQNDNFLAGLSSRDSVLLRNAYLGSGLSFALQGKSSLGKPEATLAVPGSPQAAGLHGAFAEHRFWDRENGWLFSAVAASRTLDYFSTLNMRRRGRQEIFLTNDVVDNHAGFAAAEAAATAVSIGASYLFHRYHHHRLERWTSIVHAGLATSGAVRNYCLESAHRLTPP